MSLTKTPICLWVVFLQETPCLQILFHNPLQSSFDLPIHSTNAKRLIYQISFQAPGQGDKQEEDSKNHEHHTQERQEILKQIIKIKQFSLQLVLPKNLTGGRGRKSWKLFDFRQQGQWKPSWRRCRLSRHLEEREGQASEGGGKEGSGIGVRRLNQQLQKLKSMCVRVLRSG